jgi:plasmid replication initiation protein
MEAALECKTLSMFEKDIDTVASETLTVAKGLRPDGLVKQDNKLINGRWRLNLNQTRIYLAMISMVEENDAIDQWYKISTKELKDLIEIKGNSFHEQVRKDIYKLMQTVIWIKEKDEKGRTVDDFTSLVSKARYEHGGDLFVRFEPDLKKYIIRLKNQFTQFKLREAIKFRSMYSLRIFMLLKQFDTTGWRRITLDELRFSLDINATKDNQLEKDLYTKIADFKKRILTPALLELNASGFPVEMEEHKDKRKIVAFTFTWKKRAEQQGRIDFKPKTEEGARLLERLKRLKLNDRQVRYLGDWVKAGHTTSEKLNQFCWGIESNIRDKKIPTDKVGGYAYASFKKGLVGKDF